MKGAPSDEPKDDHGAWRKVHAAMYHDEKYLALSPVQPSGRSLWQHLIHGPHLRITPGLARAGRAALAEELGWSQKAFDEAFGEISRLEMAEADWETRVIWLPNALKYNIPQSPNVVRGWKAHWASIPDCRLKAKAYVSIETFFAAFRPAHLKAFVEVCPKPLGKLSGIACTVVSPKGSGKKPLVEPRIQREERIETLPSQVERDVSGRALSGEVSPSEAVGGGAPREDTFASGWENVVPLPNGRAAS